QLRQRGGQLIVVGRFIPGGRTVVTLSAGVLRFRWRRFLVFDTAATLIWALYAALLGYFGGRAFEHAEWKGLLLALGIGLAITGLVEAVRWALRRRRGHSAIRDDFERSHADQTASAGEQTDRARAVSPGGIGEDQEA